MSRNGVPDDVNVRRGTLDVEVDGEELRVYNRVNIKQTELAEIRGGGATVETFKTVTEIGAGDSDMDPDAVTPWAAEELWHEFGVELESDDEWHIEVIDPHDEEVRVL